MGIRPKTAAQGVPPVMRADVAAEVGGKLLTFTMDMRTLLEIEESTGNPPMQEIMPLLMANTLNLSFVKVRHVLWCGLRINHPEITLAEAGEFMNAAPNALAQAFEAFLPAATDIPEGAEIGDEGQVAAKKAAPPKPRK